jgi:hypothetical protein
VQVPTDRRKPSNFDGALERPHELLKGNAFTIELKMHAPPKVVPKNARFADLEDVAQNS